MSPVVDGIADRCQKYECFYRRTAMFRKKNRCPAQGVPDTADCERIDFWLSS